MIATAMNGEYPEVDKLSLALREGSAIPTEVCGDDDAATIVIGSWLAGRVLARGPLRLFWAVPEIDGECAPELSVAARHAQEMARYGVIVDIGQTNPMSWAYRMDEPVIVVDSAQRIGANLLGHGDVDPEHRSMLAAMTSRDSIIIVDAATYSRPALAAMRDIAAELRLEPGIGRSTPKPMQLCAIWRPVQRPR